MMLDTEQALAAHATIIGDLQRQVGDLARRVQELEDRMRFSHERDFVERDGDHGEEHDR